MKTCPKCKAENLFDGAGFCSNCGAPLPPPEEITPTATPAGSDDDLEFVITETAQPVSPELFSEKGDVKPPAGPGDGLEIEDNSDLLSTSEDNFPATDPDAASLNPDFETPAAVTPDDFQINDTAVPDPNLNEPKPLPPEPISPEPISPEPVSPEPAAPENRPDPVVAPPETSRPSKGMRAYPDIEKNTGQPEPASLEAASPESVSPEAGSAAAAENKTGEIRPIKDPALAATSQVKKSTRVRGLAQFRGNTIHIIGNAYLHENDEITLNGKPYLLKPKKLDNKVKYGAFGAVMVLLLVIVGSFFINPTIGDDGEVIGLILNENGQPYLGGARVTLSALGKSTVSNAQGFFRFDLVPTGTYEIQYELGNAYVGRDNVTVMAGQSTLMTFGNLRPFELAYEPSPSSASPTATSPDRPATSSSSSSKKSSAKSSKRYGKIKLAANVDGAKLVVDGKTLGAGNNTYSKIKAGQHKVQVSRDGHTEYTEIITVKAGKTKTVRANLAPRATASATPTADDYLRDGDRAVADNNFQTAVASYTKAIELSPGSIDAYNKRADAYVSAGDHTRAAEDYIRVGEIYRIKGKTGLAVQNFTRCLEYHPGDKTALVGRGGARMDQSDYRSALIDYTEALESDESFYPALYGVGVCQFRLGNHKQAEKYLKKAHKANPDDPYLYHYLMLNYLARDDIKNLRKSYAQFKDIAGPTELAEFKSSSRFAPVIRLIKEENL